ncbi:MAG: transporter substrate-binding domain-containing protein [Alphaproteobacteria bacterium]|nr:transporter substrate-binding domain-containing protein [Alphaproteobacteria bacterium]MBL6946554.1 transporter substrate-binding domain-containing protein [Rhodospirillales bacterium]
MKVHKRLFQVAFCAFVFFLGVCTASIAAEQKPITLLAAEIPGGYLKITGNKGIGVFPDLFYEAAGAAGSHVKFRFVPWGRAFQEVERSSHLLTFPLTRLPEREAKYSWLVPLDRDEIVFLTLDQQINNLEQARKLGKILVWKGSSMEIFLTQQGFENLISVGNTKALVRMLKNGRGDAWFTIRPETDEISTPDGGAVKVVSGDVIQTESVWLVGGKSFTHSETSRRFVARVKTLVEAGRLTELKTKYGLK